MRTAMSKSKSPSKGYEISGSITKYEITNQRAIKISNLASGQSNIANQARFVRKTNRYENLRKQNKNYKEVLMANLLTQLLVRRKSYSFQMMKLLFLFPDDTFSENISINSYDRLFYQDEHIHTIVKIYETKEMEAKIWAFLNLKNLHKKRKLQKFTTKIQKIKQKMIQATKKESFDMLHMYSIKIEGQRYETAGNPQKIEPIKSALRMDQTIRTERIQRTNIINTTTNNIERVQTNEKHYSPLVKRIHLTADDVKVIYPSTIRMAGTGLTHQGFKTYILPEHEVRQRSSTKEYASSEKIRQRDTKTSQVKQNTNVDKRMVEQKQIERPTVYRTSVSEHFRKIQPVEIRSSPYSYRNQSKPVYDIHQRTWQGPRQVRDGYDYLVRNVSGDCTINIHNGCGYSQSSPTQYSRNRQCINSRPSVSVGCNEGSNCRSCCRKMKPCCSSFGSRVGINCNHVYAIQPVCQCQIKNRCWNTQQHGCCCSGNYSIEQRIRYLEKLEEMSKKMGRGKDFY